MHAGAYPPQHRPDRPARHLQPRHAAGLRRDIGIEYHELTQDILHFYTSQEEFDSAEARAAQMRELGCERRVSRPMRRCGSSRRCATSGRIWPVPPTPPKTNPATPTCFASLKGKPILVSTIGRQTYYPWLKAKYGYTDEQARPYVFGSAPFLADPRVSMEGFATSEPYELRKAGLQPVVHVLSEQGYPGYSNVTLTSPKLVAEKPELVQRFVDATAKGWASYLGADPKPGNELMKKGNAELNEDKIAYALGVLKEYAICTSDDVGRGDVGAMSDAHWKQVADSLASTGAIAAGVDPKKAYTLQFVNKRVGIVA